MVSKINKLLDNTVDNKNIFGISLCVYSGKNDFSFCGNAGNLQSDSQYFIASTTKLFVSAMILKMNSEGLLDLNDPISKHLSPSIMKELHIYKGTDYSNKITIRHLLSQTSGLPDYFEDKKENGNSLVQEITEGNDQSWSFEDVINMTKNMIPLFKPGQKNKAHYSDSNYQLLGQIIENIIKEDFATALDTMIISPLKLAKTYLYSDANDNKPAAIFYKNKPMKIPLAMISFKADGGIVSTSEEMMIFLKAFFQGKLFPAKYLNEMKHWKRVMFPLEYGTGIMRFKLPRIFSPFKKTSEFIGHSGLSGAIAFYNPDKDLYFTGTVNQAANPGSSFKLMLKINDLF